MLAALALLGVTAPAAVAQSWSIESTSIPGNVILRGVSCLSASFCMAVGNGGPTAATVAARWDGSGWTIEPTPNPAGTGFTGVSCTSASFCIAVGTSPSGPDPLAERWNGTSWSIQTIPPPPNDTATLSGVSCTSSASCTAVGSYNDNTTTGGTFPFAERWNGIVWTPQTLFVTPPTSVSALSGVSCVAPSACMATGYQNGDFPPPDSGQSPSAAPYAASWNGAAWRSQSPPNPSGFARAQLSEVSCSSSSACIAVGWGNSAAGGGFVEQWNGSTWVAQQPPAPAPLYGVSCASAQACIAVGGDTGPAAMAWDGTNWTAQSVPDPANATYAPLDAVSCYKPTDCTAVGVYETAGTNSPAEPLVERYS
jgi:hypothetical protein